MSDPFLIHGPAVISFSGGRTSAYMLHRILQAHGGRLPEDVVVCFANTGREMPATLDFVRDCGAAWNAPIIWLEYARDDGPTFREVSHNSAARDGEPFEAVVRARQFLPNPVTRFCTVELKIRTMRRFIIATRGWRKWLNVIGLRADEPARVNKATDPAKQKKDGYPTICPLATAGIEEIDVLRFWKAQPFDLRLSGPWEGNCDGCMLKSRAALSRMYQDHPARMTWWENMEVNAKQTRTREKSGATFRIDREDYATMARVVRDQGTLPFDLNEKALACEDAGCGV
jgi:3'-phosphoadenosine 5'-phosphosulfate sulfotransferase (PAPS reductase)/FAD synthetase